MGRGKIRTLLIACVTTMLCAAAVVGGTYALWSDQVQVTNHLSAGKMNVTLERVSLTRTYLDEDGYLVTQTDDETADFSGESTENIFGLNDYGTENAEKLVPGSCYSATLKLTNGGDVAFAYSVIIRCSTISSELARQLQVTVTIGDDTVAQRMLSEFSGDDEKVVANSEMTKSGAQEFTVRIEFIDNDETNNAAQEQTAAFDLIVNAVQSTQAP